MLPSTFPLAWIVWLFTGSLCAYYSYKKGRSPYIWFAIGFLASFLGLYILFLLPKATKKQPPKPKPTLKMELNRFPHPYWYYLDAEHKTQGPFSLEALERHCETNRINKKTLLWNEGLDEWKKLEDLIMSQTS